MSGYEVARQLRAKPGGSDVRIFAMTGYGQEEDRRRSHEAGFDEYIVKPFSSDVLQKLIARGRARD